MHSHEQHASGSPSVTITLRCRSPRVACGSRGFVTIEVRNVTAGDIRLVGVVDGAEAGVRYPKWTPRGVDGKALPWAEAPDFTSPLWPEDIRLLKPGAAFDPRDASDGAHVFPIAAFEEIGDLPGPHAVVLELDTDASDDAAWMGTAPDHRPDAALKFEAVRALLRDVPRGRFRSNVLEFVVE